MKIDIDRREIYKPLIENEIKELQSDSDLAAVRKVFGYEAYKQALRVAIYDSIQGTIDEYNLLNVMKNGSREELIELLWIQHRDIQILEQEIYNIKNGNQDDILNAFYGSIANEKVELLELIEEYIY
ncbi:hypothetical protein ACWOAH_09780 [Vagococcus vulneris]|uniref:Uncharacterized protein n=1 Tax=Vagococcus vulneris TaxID=1977869 RepID=A0A429ZTW7_9ENTE|nr:hypothetical protein [Vagococcus vulneris]RST97129.1 hypothetical protein CBF37_10130 [Vagococcus vulneris]